MSNSLGFYDETFFAQEALIILEKALGFSGRIFRGYNPNPTVRGDTINVRRPTLFTAADAPATASDLNPDSVAVKVDKWKAVTFKLTDKDLSLTSEKIITDHIHPAAYAIADQIDQDGVALFAKIPWSTTMSSTPALADVTALKKQMFAQKVPFNDPSKLHFMIGGTEQAAFENAMTVLANPQAAGLRDGSLGRLYGFDVWANQNTPTHTSGTMTDAAGALTADTAVGDTTIAIDAIDASGVCVAGDIVVITGDPQQYVITANATASSGAVAALAIYPAIKQVNSSGAVVTIQQAGASKTQNLGFHENFACLATAPLSDIGNQLGAKIAVINDDESGISIRSRMWYDGTNSAVYVGLDVLYGYAILDPNLACRAIQA